MSKSSRLAKAAIITSNCESLPTAVLIWHVATLAALGLPPDAKGSIVLKQDQRSVHTLTVFARTSTLPPEDAKKTRSGKEKHA
jgi:hypothetical protein